MAVYIFLALFPFVLQIFFSNLKNSKWQRRTYLIISGAILVFFVGLRHYSLGSTDTFHYYAAMKQAIVSSSFDEFYSPELYEKAFQYFVFILSRVFNNAQWLLIITSFIYIGSTLFFISRNCDDMPLAISLYTSICNLKFQMQGMRQAIAMSICLFAFEEAKKKHFWRFLAIVLFASLFHRTAIVFLVVYWLVNLRPNGVNVIFVSIGCAVALMFSSSLVNIANSLFGEQYASTVESGGFVATVIYVLVLIVCFLYYKCAPVKEEKYFPLVYICLIATTTYVMRYTGVLVAERISFYFSFTQIALIPIAAKLFKPKEGMICKVIIILLSVGLSAYRLIGSGFLPYMFFWQ